MMVSSSPTLTATPPSLSRLSLSSSGEDSPSASPVEKSDTARGGVAPARNRDSAPSPGALTRTSLFNGDRLSGSGRGRQQHSSRGRQLHSRARSSRDEEATGFVTAAAPDDDLSSSPRELRSEIFKLRARLCRAQDDVDSSRAELKDANDMIDQYRETVKTKNAIIRDLEGDSLNKGGTSRSSPSPLRGGSRSPPSPLRGGGAERQCGHCGGSGRDSGEEDGAGGKKGEQKGHFSSRKLKLRPPGFLTDDENDEDDFSSPNDKGAQRRLRFLEGENEALRRRETELELRLAASKAATDTVHSSVAALQSRLVEADEEVGRIREASHARSAMDKEEIAKLHAGRIVQTSERSSEREALRVQIKARDKEIAALRRQIDEVNEEKRRTRAKEVQKQERKEEKRREKDAPWEAVSDAVMAGMDMLCSSSSTFAKKIEKECFPEAAKKKMDGATKDGMAQGGASVGQSPAAATSLQASVVPQAKLSLPQN